MKNIKTENLKCECGCVTFEQDVYERATVTYSGTIDATGNFNIQGILNSYPDEREDYESTVKCSNCGKEYDLEALEEV